MKLGIKMLDDILAREEAFDAYDRAMELNEMRPPWFKVDDLPPPLDTGQHIDKVWTNALGESTLTEVEVWRWHCGFGLVRCVHCRRWGPHEMHYCTVTDNRRIARRRDRLSGGLIGDLFDAEAVDVAWARWCADCRNPFPGDIWVQHEEWLALTAIRRARRLCATCFSRRTGRPVQEFELAAERARIARSAWARR